MLGLMSQPVRRTYCLPDVFENSRGKNRGLTLTTALHHCFTQPDLPLVVHHLNASQHRENRELARHRPFR